MGKNALTSIITLLLSLSLYGQTFNNPVIRRVWPDPTVWSDGNRFYTTCTGVKTILTSDDLVNWTDLKISPLSEEAYKAAKETGRHFWAPDVTRIGDKWMLYLTCYNSAQDCGIAVFESSSPTGPWEFSGRITHSRITGIKDTIDPEIVADPETDKIWMFFGSIGGIHRIELNPEGTSIKEGAGYEHIAGLDINRNKSRSRVYEGAYLYRRDGWWYLFASAGNYGDHSYRIVVGRSRSLEGRFTDKEGNDMADGNASVIMMSEPDDDFFGPGHNGEIITDSKGHDYIIYHCHQKSTGREHERYSLLQRIHWDKDGWPYVKTGKPAVKEGKPNLNRK